MEKTNTKLQLMIEDHQQQRDLQINPLSMLLNGICDAAVNGGLSNYKVYNLCNVYLHTCISVVETLI